MVTFGGGEVVLSWSSRGRTWGPDLVSNTRHVNFVCHLWWTSLLLITDPRNPVVRSFFLSTGASPNPIPGLASWCCPPLWTETMIAPQKCNPNRGKWRWWVRVRTGVSTRATDAFPSKIKYCDPISWYRKKSPSSLNALHQGRVRTGSIQKLADVKPISLLSKCNVKQTSNGEWLRTQLDMLKKHTYTSNTVGSSLYKEKKTYWRKLLAKSHASVSVLRIATFCIGNGTLILNSELKKVSIQYVPRLTIGIWTRPCLSEFPAPCNLPKKVGSQHFKNFISDCGTTDKSQTCSGVQATR